MQTLTCVQAYAHDVQAYACDTQVCAYDVQAHAHDMQRCAGLHTAHRVPQVLLLLGHFSLLAPTCQCMLTWGRENSILHRLAGVPPCYFTHPQLAQVRAAACMFRRECVCAPPATSLTPGLRSCVQLCACAEVNVCTHADFALYMCVRVRANVAHTRNALICKLCLSCRGMCAVCVNECI